MNIPFGLVMSLTGTTRTPEFWDTPTTPWLPILVIHIRSQVKTTQSQSYKIKKKCQKIEILQETLHATHLLKLLGKMYKYEMDPTRTVGATERTCVMWDGWMDGRTKKKCQKIEILQETLHATHLLKLLGKMYKYEMDPTRTVGATERTCVMWDGWMDGRTCRQATSHYLSQCWPRSLSPNGVTRPQWFKLRLGLRDQKRTLSCYKGFYLLKWHSIRWDLEISHANITVFERSCLILNSVMYLLVALYCEMLRHQQGQGGQSSHFVATIHDDIIKWKHFPRYWPFVPGIHRPPVNSPHKGQWSGALMFSLICAWINGWVNTCEAGDLRCHHAHYDVTVMLWELQLALPLPVMVMVMTTVIVIWKTRIWFIRSNRYKIDQVLQIIIIKGIGLVKWLISGLIYRCSVFTIDYLHGWQVHTRCSKKHNTFSLPTLVKS